MTPVYELDLNNIEITIETLVTEFDKKGKTVKRRSTYNFYHLYIIDKGEYKLVDTVSTDLGRSIKKRLRIKKKNNDFIEEMNYGDPLRNLRVIKFEIVAHIGNTILLSRIDKEGEIYVHYSLFHKLFKPCGTI